MYTRLLFWYSKTYHTVTRRRDLPPVKVKAHVLLNCNPEGFLRGYREGDCLRHAPTFDVDEPGPGDACYEALEYVFFLGNVDSGGCRAEDQEQVANYREAGCRSLSVGDVVVLERFGAFKVDKVGFTELCGDERAEAYSAAGLQVWS